MWKPTIHRRTLNRCGRVLCICGLLAAALFGEALAQPPAGGPREGLRRGPGEGDVLAPERRRDRRGGDGVGRNFGGGINPAQINYWGLSARTRPGIGEWCPVGIFTRALDAQQALQLLRRNGCDARLSQGLASRSQWDEYVVLCQRGWGQFQQRFTPFQRERFRGNPVERGGFDNRRRSVINEAGFDPYRRSVIDNAGFSPYRRETINTGGFGYGYGYGYGSRNGNGFGRGFSGGGFGGRAAVDPRGNFGTGSAAAGNAGRRGNFGTRPK